MSAPRKFYDLKDLYNFEEAEKSEKAAASAFALVCNLATAVKKEELRAKIDSHEVSLGIRQGIFTPVADLARQGNLPAEQLLLELGASADDAVFGHASATKKNDGTLSTHLKRISVLQPLCKRRQLPMLQGFAYCANNEPVFTELRQRCGFHNDELMDLLHLSAAAGENPQLLETLARYKAPKKMLYKGLGVAKKIGGLDLTDESTEIRQAAIEGLLAGCHYSLAAHTACMLNLPFLNNPGFLLAYIESGGTEHIPSFVSRKCALDKILHALAFAGRHRELEKVLKEEKGLALNIFIHAIALGYDQAGYFDNPNVVTSLIASFNDPLLKKYVTEFYYKERNMGFFKLAPTTAKEKAHPTPAAKL